MSAIDNLHKLNSYPDSYSVCSFRASIFVIDSPSEDRVYEQVVCYLLIATYVVATYRCKCMYSMQLFQFFICTFHI